MSHVITEKCVGERYATCQGVCPVEAIHAADYNNEPFMIIDPETCIDCGVCLTECPIGAIVSSVDEDPKWAQINKDLVAKYKGSPKPPVRSPNDPPKKAVNKLVNVK
ncbi:MAG: ferredoxin family protein [Elusimicrobia bacterium]|nr:ferredoxin family protein [Elusimicrobiota bacterium]